ncbi:translocation/assembly module TamB domain-containing protein [Halosquirtibacter xylanolyticus]|uniref:translocation/assembly module TamB domain-containing protein n=1 Tax=Halosquirtibacter xylanolyticus TaxID=3374599 RepID=UPI00374A65BA
MLIITLCACYVALMSSRVQTLIVQSITDDISQQLGAQISIRKVDIRFFNKLVLKDFLLKDQKQDTLLFSKALVVEVDSLNLEKQQLFSNSILLESAYINSKRYKDSLSYNYQFLVDSLHSDTPQESGSPWQFQLRNVRIEDAHIKNNDENVKELSDLFDYRHIDLKNITVDFSTSRMDSLLLFNLNQFSLKEIHSVELKNITGKLSVDPQQVQIHNLKVETGFSKLEVDSCFMQLKQDSVSLDMIKRPFYLHFKKSSVSLKEVAYFVPEIKGMNEVVSLKGTIKGPVSNLKGKDFELRVKDHTMLKGNVGFSGLPNIKNTFIFARLDRAVVDLREVRRIRMPLSFGAEYMNLPESIDNEHQLYYEGEFTGFPSDFVSFGTLTGALGKVDTDIAIRPDDEGKVSVSGVFNTTNFKLGELVQSESLANLTLRSNLHGYYTNEKDYDLKVVGTIDDIQIKDYIVHSIFLNGRAYAGGFEGGVKIQDPHLNLDFNGKVDYMAEIPSYNFHLNVTDFVPAYLKQSEINRIDTLNLALQANFTGNSIDNFKGSVNIDRFDMANGNHHCTFNDILMETDKQQGQRNFRLSSDFVNIGIIGDYTYKSLYHSVRNILSSHLPSLSSESVLTDNNNITIKGQITDDKGLLQYFSPKSAIRFPIEITGALTDSTHTANLLVDIPEVYHDNNLIKHLTLNIFDNQRSLQARARASKLSIGDGYSFHNLALHSRAENDTIFSLISWSNADEMTYSGNIPIQTIISRDNEVRRVPKFRFKVDPSYVFVADHEIGISQSTIDIDSSSVAISGLEITNMNHRLKIDGKMSSLPNDSMNIKFNDVEIGKIDTICAWDTGLSGNINGIMTLKDLYRHRIVLGDLFIKDFSFSDKPLGDISLKSDWNSIDKELFSQLLLLKDERRILDAHGTFSPSQNRMDYDAELDKVPFISLMPFLKHFSYHLGGSISGKVKVQGKATHPYLVGTVLLDKGEVGIDFTKTTYTISDSVTFVPDTMKFVNMGLIDEEGNTGSFNGYIKHDFFSNFVFDLNIATDYLSVLNTTVDDNEEFYGTAHGIGNVRLTGNTDDLNLSANVKTGLGTNITIPMVGPSSATENSFIRFKKPKRFFKVEEVLKQGEVDEYFTLNLDLTMTPDAKFRILFDRNSADLIEGTGSGDMRIIYDKEGDISMYGNYTIDKGNYNFTRQGFISKHFKVKENSTLSWEGDPYKARLNLEAVYSTKASLKELLGESSSSNDYSKRIKVDCIIKLTNDLSNPKVDFAIELPTADERTKDEIAQYLSTKEEITRQMISILLIGKFTTPDYLKGADSEQSNNADIISSTASELLSNQFSSWLSEISNDFDIGFNYRPGDNVSDRQIEVALSTQLLNNRVLINGNIGNNGSLQSKNANEIVGEVEVYVKLTKNGKLQLKVYNRSNDELLYDTAPYTQGVGVTFKENFNSFDELFERYKRQRAERKERRQKRRLLKKQQKQKAEEEEDQTEEGDPKSIKEEK